MTEQEIFNLKRQMATMDGHQRTELLSKVLRLHVDTLRKTTTDFERLLDLLDEQERRATGE